MMQANKPLKSNIQQNKNKKIPSEASLSELERGKFRFFKRKGILFLGFILSLSTLIITFAVKSFEQAVVYDVFGVPQLSPERQRELDDDLDKIDHAEQYALKAKKNGYYPCLSCQNPQDSVYLKIDEVYRYGTTMNGEKGRYGNLLDIRKLFYERQFVGTYSACLKQEKIKIYQYPLLPENLGRTTKLLRPPGNPQDR